MKRAKRLAPAVTAALIALPALAAPAASADQTVTPAQSDFGALPIGATSATVPLTFTASCHSESPGCGAADPVQVSIASTSPDFTIVSEDCPDGMPGIGAGTSCTIMVRYSPIAIGPRGGLIETGEHAPFPLGPPEPTTTGEVVGTGICSTCFPGNSTGALPAYVIPGPGFNLAGDVSDSKKCKKKKSKAARKKCKKKKKRK